MFHTMARILLAEDDAISRLYMSETLARSGHQVVAPDDAGRLMAELQQTRFDLVLTDLKMPQVDGWQVASWLQQHQPGTPVIAVSGFTSYLPPEHLQPFAAILRKPVRATRLLAVVSDTLARSGRGA
jgi:CheY-like chemotaxis protein